MLVVGLTGSMAMGKSETAKMFAAENVPFFDADVAVHHLYDKGGKAVELIRTMCPHAVHAGAVDRRRLADAVRDDSSLLLRLESVVHPLVREEERRFLQRMKAQHEKIVLVDMPLLFETGRDKEVDKIVVVSAPADIQLKRILDRPGMSKTLAAILIANQLPDSEKRKRADFIVDTGKGFDFARGQVHAIVRELKTLQESR